MSESVLTLARRIRRKMTDSRLNEGLDDYFFAGRDGVAEYDRDVMRLVVTLTDGESAGWKKCNSRRTGDE